MANNRWASGTIAGISVVDAGGRDCRIDILDGEALREAYIGNITEALDLSVHFQLISRNKKSVRFGVHIAQLTVAKRNSILTAIETAIGAGNSFTVVLADAAGVDNISVYALPDFAALEGRLYKRGTMAAGYIKDIMFRFITTGIYAP